MEKAHCWKRTLITMHTDYLLKMHVFIICLAFCHFLMALNRLLYGMLHFVSAQCVSLGTHASILQYFDSIDVYLFWNWNNNNNNSRTNIRQKARKTFNFWHQTILCVYVIKKVRKITIICAIRPTATKQNEPECRKNHMKRNEMEWILNVYILIRCSFR